MLLYTAAALLQVWAELDEVGEDSDEEDEEEGEGGEDQDDQPGEAWSVCQCRVWGSLALMCRAVLCFAVLLLLWRCLCFGQTPWVPT
jgi:hypothetical protein